MYVYSYTHTHTHTHTLTRAHTHRYSAARHQAEALRFDKVLEPGNARRSQAKATSHTSIRVPIFDICAKYKVESGKKKRPGLGPNAEPTLDGQETLMKPPVRPLLPLLRTACGAVRFVCVCMCVCMLVCVCVCA